MIEFPSKFCPPSDKWELNYNISEFVSELSNHVQRKALAGDFWTVEFMVRTIDRRTSEFKEVSAFLAKLRGGLNSFKMPVFAAKNKKDLGTVTLNIAAVTNSINVQVKGLTGDFEEGDFITIGNQLFIIAEAGQQVSGIANLTLSSPLRNGLPVGAVVEYKIPFCIMTLQNPNFAITNSPIVSAVNFSFRERF